MRQLMYTYRTSKCWQVQAILIVDLAATYMELTYLATVCI
jgi:hypothetical protein